MPATISYRSFDILSQIYLGQVPIENATFDRQRPPNVGTLRGTVDLAAAFSIKSETAGLRPSFSGYAAVVLGDKPTAYWRLGEQRGPAAADSSPWGNDGTYSATGIGLNRVGALAGDTDTCAVFDGVSGNAVVVPKTQFAASQPFSVEAWVYPNGSTNRAIFYSAQGTGDLILYLETDNSVWWRMQGPSGGGAFTDPNAAPNGQWSHIVGTYDGSTLRVYVNGVLSTHQHTFGASFATSGSWYIGSKLATRRYAGAMDELSIYPVALTQAQITAHYTAGVTMPAVPPPAGFSTLLEQLDPDAVTTARLRQVLSALQPGRLLIADFGGSPVWWGLVTRPSYDSSNAQISVNAEEVWSYFRDYPLRQDLNYGNNGVGLKDQTTEIFKDMVDWVQSQSAWSNIHVDTSTIVASGVLRERHYLAQDRRYVGELCGELSHVDNGFEFLIDCAYDSAHKPKLSMVTGYPRLGQRFDPANPGSVEVWKYDKDVTSQSSILSYTWPEDLLQMATFVDAVSHNTDGTVVIATSPINQSFRDLDIADRVVIVNFDGVVDVTGTLQGHANAEANKRATTTAVPTVKVIMQDFFGYCHIGNDVLFSLRDWRFPTRVLAVYRLIGFTADIAAETVDMVLDVTNA